MTNRQLEKIMATLQLRQLDLANLFKVTPRQVRRWQKGDADVPVAEAVLLRLLASGAIDVDTIAKAAK